MGSEFIERTPDRVEEIAQGELNSLEISEF